MARPTIKKAFSLYRKAGRPNYYVRFRNKETGDFMTGHSTGTADIQRAEEIAMNWLVNGIPEKESLGAQAVIDLVRRTNLTAQDVEQILKEFKDRGFLSAYVMKGSRKEVKAIDYFLDFYSTSNPGRIADGRIITKGHAMAESRLVKKYWLPFIGDRLLSEITTEDLKTFKIELQNTLLADTYKRSILNTGLVALRQARCDGLIDEDITSGIRNFKGKAKKKEILTPEQAEALFKSDWKSNKIKLGNYLAYRTGFRVGEVIGLQKEDLRCIDGKYFIQLRHSFSRDDGLKGTKTNTDELIPISDTYLMKMLLYLANTNPYNNGFVFWSDKATRKDKPICAKQMLQGLKEQLTDCGFPDSSQRVTFHSWRHFNRTYMQVVGKVSSRTLSKVTGHSVPMIDNLYSNHWTEEDCVEYEEGVKRLYKPVSEYFAVPVEYDCSEPLLLEG